MPERLIDPRYWKQTTQDIEGAFAAPPKPQGTPGAFIENVNRPTDQFANQIGEQISPTLGAFGMGQLAGDTALRFSEGDYTGAAMNAPLLAMAAAPGLKRGGAFLMDDAARLARARELGFNPERRWYHGSTHDIKAFDNSKSNIESDLGRGTYLTSSPEDAWTNYNKQGPDLTNRIEQRAEQLFAERKTQPQWDTPEYERAMRAARKKAEREIAGDSDGAIYPVVTKDEGVLDLTNNSKQRIDFSSEYDDAGELVAESPNALKLYESLQRSASKYDDVNVDKVMEDIGDLLYDDVRATDLDALLRKSEGLIYAQDPETGTLASHEIIRQLYEDLGYRGATVDANGRWPNMKMPPGTQHRVMFHPEDLRSPFANFDTEKAGSADILAGAAGAFTVPALLSSQGQDTQE
jgi:hypothetical protein